MAPEPVSYGRRLEVVKMVTKTVTLDREDYSCLIAALRAAKRHLDDSTSFAHDSTVEREKRLYDTDDSAQRARKEIVDLLETLPR